MIAPPGTASPPERLLRARDLPFVLLAALLLLVTLRGLFLSTGVPYERDSTLLEIPGKMETVRLLGQGRLPLWSNARGNGQPFLANAKTAVFYPGTWLFLVFPVVTAWKLHTFLHLLLGWAGLFALVRAYGFRARTAFFAATWFYLGGLMLSSVEFTNHPASYAWMFWILAVLRRSPGASPRSAAVLAVMTALLVFSGTPHVVVLAIVLAALQEAALTDRPPAKLAAFAGAVALGIGLAAVQVVPSVELAARAAREAAGLGEWSLEPVQLLETAFPGILGWPHGDGPGGYWAAHLFDRDSPLYPSFYLNGAALLLAAWGWRRSPRRFKFVVGAGAGLFLLLAFGRHVPPLMALQSVASVRYPVKYAAGVLICLSLLAAAGYERVFGGEDAPVRRRRVPAFLVAIVPAALVLGFILRKPAAGILSGLFATSDPVVTSQVARSLARGIAWLAIALAAAAWARRSPRAGPALGTLLAVAIFVDLAVTNGRIVPVTRPDFFRRPAVAAGPGTTVYHEETPPRDLLETAGGGVAAMSFLRQTLYPESGIGSGLRYLHDFDRYGTYDRESREVASAAASLPPPRLAAFLRNTGCSTAVLRRPLPGYPPGERSVGGIRVAVQAIQAPPPPVALFTRTETIPGLAARIQRLADAEFDAKTIAAVDASANLAEEASGSTPGRVKTYEAADGVFHGVADLDRDALVAVAGRSAPGWKAWVDGRRTRLYSVNLTSKGVVVPAGRHEVRMAYRPASIAVGGVLSALAALGWLVLAAAAMPARANRRIPR